MTGDKGKLLTKGVSEEKGAYNSVYKKGTKEGDRILKRLNVKRRRANEEKVNMLKSPEEGKNPNELRG